MTLAHEPGETWEYVLLADRKLEDGDPGKPIFTLKRLSARERARIDDKAAEGTPGTRKKAGKVHIRQGSTILAYLDQGLVGWENLHNAAGESIEFDRNKAQKNYDRLPQDVLDELADALATGNQLEDDEVKN